MFLFLIACRLLSESERMRKRVSCEFCASLRACRIADNSAVNMDCELFIRWWTCIWFGMCIPYPVCWVCGFLDPSVYMWQWFG